MWWWSRRPSYFWGGALIVVGVLLLLGNVGLLNNLNWDYIWPVLLIAFGVWLIVARVLPGGGPTFGGPFVGAAMGSVALDRSDPREGLSKAKLQVEVGSARLDVRGAALGDLLYRARIDHSGTPPEVQLDRSTGTVRISQRGNWMVGGWGRVKLDVQLNDAVSWELDLDSGSIKGTVDLSTVPLAKFECDSASSRIDLSVSQPSGEVPIRVEGGSVDIRLRRPSGAAARVHAAGGSIRVTADGVRQNGFGSLAWQSTGFDASPNRYDARFSGGSVRAEVEQH
jgi:cell wall-active antibiotic response 4TMS protein YvqF